MDRYAARGVSSSKEEVHAVVDKLDKGSFPLAFCKILPDFLTGEKDWFSVIHADGAGTKSILAYLHYKETGDPSVFRGTAVDSVVMNLDDLICIGVVDKILLSSTVNRNARRCPGEVLKHLIEGTEEFLETLRSWGVGIESGGGETADVGDLTGSITVDSCAVARLHRSQVIGQGIKPGQIIIGFSSFGKTKYESKENSGIGSNGLTSARHEMLSSYYREKYPETFDTGTSTELVYCGPYRLEDPLPNSAMSVGQALLSPTRTYAPLISRLLKEKFQSIGYLVHCSGGAQTKCLKFGMGVHIVKDNLFPVPPLFEAIQKCSGTTEREMHKVYNMGHRLELYCDQVHGPWIMAMASEMGLESRIIGRTEPSRMVDGSNHLTIVRGTTILQYPEHS